MLTNPKPAQISLETGQTKAVCFVTCVSVSSVGTRMFLLASQKKSTAAELFMCSSHMRPFPITFPGSSHVSVLGGGCFQANLEQKIPNLKSRPQVIIQGICREGFVVSESRSWTENPPIALRSPLNWFAFLSSLASWLLLLCAKPKVGRTFLKSIRDIWGWGAKPRYLKFGAWASFLWSGFCLSSTFKALI